MKDNELFFGVWCLFFGSLCWIVGAMFLYWTFGPADIVTNVVLPKEVAEMQTKIKSCDSAFQYDAQVMECIKIVFAH